MQKISLFFVLIAAISLTSCRNGSSSPSHEQVKADSSAANPEAAATQTIHDFYGWYIPMMENPKGLYDFVSYDKTSKGYVLKNDLLEAFLKKFSDAGFVSKGFLEKERTFYTSKTKSWAETPRGDVLEGFDFDHILCGQDGDGTTFKNAAIAVTMEGEIANATMKISSTPHKIKLIKEDGKWKIDEIVCGGLDASTAMDEKGDIPMLTIKCDKKGKMTYKGRSISMDNFAKEMEKELQSIKKSGKPLPTSLDFDRAGDEPLMGVTGELRTQFEEVKAKVEKRK